MTDFQTNTEFAQRLNTWHTRPKARITRVNKH